MHLPWALLSTLLVKTGASAARSTDAALRKGLERSLKHRTAHPPKQGGNRCDRHFLGEIVVPRSLDDTIELFEAFSISELSSWRKVTSHVDGPRGCSEAIFTGNFTFPVRLEPRSAWTRMRAGMEAANGFDPSPSVNVPYRYVVRFQFRRVEEAVRFPGMPPERVCVSYHTTETVAPNGLLDRDVTYHYEAPELPFGTGAVGDRLIDFLSVAASGGR